MMTATPTVSTASAQGANATGVQVISHDATAVQGCFAEVMRQSAVGVGERDAVRSAANDVPTAPQRSAGQEADGAVNSVAGAKAFLPSGDETAAEQEVPGEGASGAAHDPADATAKSSAEKLAAIRPNVEVPANTLELMSGAAKHTEAKRKNSDTGIGTTEEQSSALGDGPVNSSTACCVPVPVAMTDSTVVAEAQSAVADNVTAAGKRDGAARVDKDKPAGEQARDSVKTEMHAALPEAAEAAVSCSSSGPQPSPDSFVAAAKPPEAQVALPSLLSTTHATVSLHTLPNGREGTTQTTTVLPNASELKDASNLNVVLLDAIRPNQLEVGLRGGDAGWMRVRAELGSDGTVSAYLRGPSSASDVLHAQAPRIEAYLGTQDVAVRSVQVETWTASATSSMNAGGGANQREPHGQTAPTAQSSAAGDEETTYEDDALPAWMTSDHGLAASTTGGWLSVRA